MRLPYFLTLGLSLASVFLATADDWPNWRGPGQNGVSAEANWLDQWPASGPRVAWKKAVGIGFSSVAVQDGKAVTMGNDENVDTLYCFHAESGTELWKQSYDSDLGAKYFEGGPTATPTFDGGNLFAVSRWGDVLCLDVQSGKILWQKNVQKETGARVPGWGFSGSPTVHGDLLLLNIGEAGMALQKSTGEIRWKSGTGEAGYSTPLLRKKRDLVEVVFSSGKGYVGADPKTGKVSWQIPWPTRYGVNSADPILVDDQLFLSSGYEKGSALFNLASTPPKAVWQNKALRTQMNPAALLDGFLYGVDGDTTSRATLKCIALKSGEVKWSFEGVGSGSLIAADGRLLVLSDKGEFMVGKASPGGFTPSARAQVLGGKCWTSPTLANGRFYARNSRGDLVCLDLRPPGGR